MSSFKVKDEVRIKPEFIELYKEMGLKDINAVSGTIMSLNHSKIGRIIVLQDDMAQVDFWNTTPVKFTIKLNHLELHKEHIEYSIPNEENEGEESSLFGDMVKKKKPTEEHLMRAGIACPTSRETIMANIPVSKVYDITDSPQVTPEFSDNHIKPKKYNDNKPMISLIRPEFQLAMAEALTYGATKYDEKRGDTPNYLKGNGFHYSTIIDSLERHINAFKSGIDVDEESGLQHLALASVNLMFLHTYLNSDKGIDDRVTLKGKKCLN